jgi:hypothetical protein
MSNRLNNEKWYEALGEVVERLAKAPLNNIERGLTLENIYNQMLNEVERDAREEKNK